MAFTAIFQFNALLQHNATGSVTVTEAAKTKMAEDERIYQFGSKSSSQDECQNVTSEPMEAATAPGATIFISHPTHCNKHQDAQRTRNVVGMSCGCQKAEAGQQTKLQHATGSAIAASSSFVCARPAWDPFCRRNTALFQINNRTEKSPQLCCICSTRDTPRPLALLSSPAGAHPCHASRVCLLSPVLLCSPWCPSGFQAPHTGLATPVLNSAHWRAHTSTARETRVFVPVPRTRVYHAFFPNLPAPHAVSTEQHRTP
eukprot:498966-Rhodomonas_salina.1